ncbi:MAG: hypothetical protein ABIR54_21785 [Burkholderiaceae bacterium]
MHSLKVLFALTAAAALTACGGGGDSPAPPSPSPSPTPVVGTNGTLQTSVSAPSYSGPVASRQVDAFNTLNAVRLGAGAGLLAQSTVLDTSATKHTAYLTSNGFNTADSAHDEVSTGIGFYEANPFLRMKKAGYSYSYATEVIGDIGSTSSTNDCVGDLLNTVYHAASMLSRVTEAGVGFGGAGTAAAGMCTIDMASPLSGGGARQIPPSGAIVAYPFGGSTVAHGTFRVDNESPRVSRSLISTPTAGTPVVIGFRNQDVVAGGAVTITRFSMATSGGTAVPGVILGAVAQGSAAAVTGTNVNPDTSLDTDFAVFVPSSPLPAGTYTVTLHATIGGGQALGLTTWSFTVSAL